MTSLSLFFSCSGRKYFYRPNKQIVEISLDNAIVTKTFFNNRENKKIAITHILSTSKHNNDITILFIPPNGGNSSILSKLMQPLVNAGYNAYLFDYEGYGESEGKADNTNVLKDAQMMLDYVIANKKDHENLCVWGFSLGGNLAVKLAFENQSKIDVLVIEGAFTSHRNIAYVTVPRLFKWTAKFIQSPYPSEKFIKDIQLPIFIAHSINDKVCPFSMGEILYNNAHNPKFFLKLSGDHCHGLLQESDRYIENLKLFLMQNKR
ncbi:MAG: lysophospholipase [Candidatus Symbiothrix sp.]|jgi:alpha-beta hydrolase superfamily lysophospholipase|nr:lysophospholipase [Candidatus Symbiothrix sp.]